MCALALSVHAKILSFWASSHYLSKPDKNVQVILFSKLLHTLQSAICFWLVTKQSTKPFGDIFKSDPCLLPRDMIPRICAICSVLLRCEVKAAQKLSAVSIHYPHPNPQSQVLNCFLSIVIISPCHSNLSSRSYIFSAYHLIVTTAKLKRGNETNRKEFTALPTQNPPISQNLTSALWSGGKKNDRTQLKVIFSCSHMSEHFKVIFRKPFNFILPILTWEN